MERDDRQPGTGDTGQGWATNFGYTAKHRQSPIEEMDNQLDFGAEARFGAIRHGVEETHQVGTDLKKHDDPDARADLARLCGSVGLVKLENAWKAIQRTEGFGAFRVK